MTAMLDRGRRRWLTSATGGGQVCQPEDLARFVADVLKLSFLSTRCFSDPTRSTNQLAMTRTWHALLGPVACVTGRSTDRPRTDCASDIAVRGFRPGSHRLRRTARHGDNREPPSPYSV